VAFGDPAAPGLELRFIAANADVQAGDVLSTSGVDGIYPPGLQVARVDRVERRSDSAFARITLQPVALVQGALHVIVLSPLAVPLTLRPAADAASAPARKALRK
ncbi:MAG: rod shape-determining protein MreC, partial [Burkholderiaceae bacterium]